ncbi:hypothetical protein FVK34_23225 [Escherichia coli]|uniref:hypothetical protein n=1 Tax=Escherichia coli TaxID=562 RepID=UPI000BDEB0A6|nr:hypothetical protein [Escherichia coli]EFN6172764.1 hypothetical protein [Escherichia coli]EGE3004110.1 hypothetical protein [Escherichia coli]ELU2825675.1 hypothetical protein [Escherichia coli]GDD80763.1 hypothetical protein HmCmsJML218_00293 [Escherichia coli]HAI0142516.1 hypothetical protein [Escherichia coli]
MFEGISTNLIVEASKLNFNVLEIYDKENDQVSVAFKSLTSTFTFFMLQDKTFRLDLNGKIFISEGEIIDFLKEESL